MASSLPLTTNLLVLLFLFPLASSTSAAATARTRPFSKIYAFGDSFTDTGNTHSTTGPYSFGYVSSPPYGCTFFHHSTNRYSDGRLVVDFLATTLSLPFLPPYLSSSNAAASNNATDDAGVNFAVAGATAIEHEFFVKNNVTLDITPQSIMTQLGWFEKHLKQKGCGGRGVVKSAPECQKAMEDALFWVGEIGANDYAYSYTASSALPPELIQNLAVGKVTKFLEALLKKGAKYIIVQGLPLTGCLPLAMALAPKDDRDDIGCTATVNKQSHAHNHLLLAKLQGLRQKHPDAVIAYADYYAAHRTVMKSPARYGFTEPFKTCCGSGGGAYNFDIFATCGSPEVSKACAEPAKFINWDGVHMTESMYKVVAEMLFHRSYCQPAFRTLLSRKSHGK